MLLCRYVGGDSSTIGDRDFDAVGQQASMSEQGYREAVLGGAAFLPEAEFQKIGFTVDELEKFGPLGMRVDPTNDFCVKLMRAQERYRGIRFEMETGIATVLADFSE